MKRVLGILPYVGIAIAVVLLLYYPVSEAIDAYRREQVAAQLDTTAEETSDEVLAEMIAQATAYNQVLGGLEPAIARADIWPYERQMLREATRNVAIAYVRIPELSLTMPVYHGTSDAALSMGVGHLESTSLPVGGQSSHSVLSAHTGMQGMRAFDDIGKLEPDDVVGVKALGEMRCWRVTSTEIVEPDDTSSFDIVQGADRLTLVTCWPYGVNDHRLLVHCERCEVPEGFEEAANNVASVLSSPNMAGLWALLAIAAVVVLLLVIRAVMRRRNKKILAGAASAGLPEDRNHAVVGADARVGGVPEEKGNEYGE